MIPFNTIDDNENKGRHFHSAVSYDKYIFFIPRSYPAILRLDTETDEIAYCTDWVDTLFESASSCIEYPYTAFLSANTLVVDNILWLVSMTENIIIAFNLETYTSQLYRVGKSEYRYNFIFRDGSDYLLFPVLNSGTPIVKWNPDSGIIKELPGIYDEYDIKCSMYRAHYCSGNIWLFQKAGGYTFIINTETGKADVFDECKYDIGGCSYCDVLNDNMHMYNAQKGTLIQYDCRERKVSERGITLSPEVRTQYRQHCADEFLKQLKTYDIDPGRIYEYSENTFSDFVDYISCSVNNISSATENIMVIDDAAGNRIYEYTRELIYGST